MSTTPNESKILRNTSSTAVSKKGILAKKWKFEAIVKLASYILYGFLFGMLPLSFKFANTQEVFPIESNSIIALVALALLSIAIIYWTFKGDIRKYIPISYYTTHLLNAALLVVGVFVISWFPIGSSINLKSNIEARQFILMVSSLGWAVVMSLTILIQFVRVKKLFPLSWTKISYTWLVLIISSTINLFIFLASSANVQNQSSVAIILQVIGLCVYLFAFLLFIFGVSFIKVYRDVLLGERTDFEIQKINDWEDVKVLSIISASVAVITFIIGLLWKQPVKMDMILIIEITLDAFLVAIYFVMVLITKIQNHSSDIKKSKFVRTFKSIDHIFLLETIVWIILMKTAIIQGSLISSQSIVGEDLFYQTVASFTSVVSLYVISTIFAIQTPNIRNSIISVATIIGSIFLQLITLAFVTEFNVAKDHPAWLSLYMVLPILLGISVSLIVRIYMVGQIFRGTRQTIALAQEASLEQPKSKKKISKKKENKNLDLETESPVGVEELV